MASVLKNQVGQLLVAGVAALCLVAGASAVWAQAAAQPGDVVAGPGGQGIAFHLITAKGSLGFSIPGGWGVQDAKPNPPVATMELQIPDAAAATPADATRVTLSLYSLDSDKGRAAMAEAAKLPGAVSRYKDWIVHSREAQQGPLDYSIVEAVREAPQAQAGISVRLAWPHLKGHPADYGQTVETAYHQLLDSIVAQAGPYTPGKNERVSRVG